MVLTDCREEGKKYGYAQVHLVTSLLFSGVELDLPINGLKIIMC